jgi:hypothetical protein
MCSAKCARPGSSTGSDMLPTRTCANKPHVLSQAYMRYASFGCMRRQVLLVCVNGIKMELLLLQLCLQDMWKV